VCNGTTIGSKRLERTVTINTTSVRVVISEWRGKVPLLSRVRPLLIPSALVIRSHWERRRKKNNLVIIAREDFFHEISR